MAKSVCSGKVIEAYSSFPAAREGCKNNDICNGIFDAGCDDENFLTCQGKIKSHVDRINKDFIESSCAWDRGILALLLFSHLCMLDLFQFVILCIIH